MVKTTEPEDWYFRDSDLVAKEELELDLETLPLSAKMEDDIIGKELKEDMDMDFDELDMKRQGKGFKPDLTREPPEEDKFFEVRRKRAKKTGNNFIIADKLGEKKKDMKKIDRFIKKKDYLAGKDGATFRKRKKLMLKEERRDRQKLLNKQRHAVIEKAKRIGEKVDGSLLGMPGTGLTGPSFAMRREFKTQRKEEWEFKISERKYMKNKERLEKQEIYFQKKLEQDKEKLKA